MCMFDIGLGNRVYLERFLFAMFPGSVKQGDDWAGISELGGRTDGGPMVCGWDGILGNVR